MILFICKIRREALKYEKNATNKRNLSVTWGGPVNSYNIIKYVNNKDYEKTNRNISNFS